MKREVKTTEDGMLVAELRPAADFAEGSFQSMAWPEGDGVTAVTGVLTEDETIAVQGLEFDAEAFDAETAQAWLDENEGALLEWRGERAEEEKDAGKGLSRDQVRAVAEKVREEADELGRALEGESDAWVVSEAADVLYHLMVGLLARGVPLADVQGELLRRFGVSGHAEKASRE